MRRLTFLLFFVFNIFLADSGMSNDVDFPSSEADNNHHLHLNEDATDVLSQKKKLYKKEIFPFFYPLIKDFKKIGLPVKYIIQAVLLIDEVTFVEFRDENLSGVYNKLANSVKLGISFVDLENDRIKKAKDLTKFQISTIYHEMWHVLYHQFFKVKRPLFYYLYLNQLSKNYPGDFYGNVYQSESYGVYIDQVIMNYLDFYFVFKQAGYEGREKIRQSEKMKKRFFEMLNRPAYGYRFSIFERGVISSKINLSIEDRMMIFEYIFNQEISFIYSENFKEDLFN